MTHNEARNLAIRTGRQLGIPILAIANYFNLSEVRTRDICHGIKAAKTERRLINARKATT